MPDPKQHQAKADHNRACLELFSDDRFCDWMAVVAFYTAVHLVEKLRAYNGQHSIDHTDRNKAVRNQYRQIHTGFHELYNWAYIARYSTLQKFTMASEEVRKVLIDRYLVEIEKFVAAQSAAATKTSASKGN